MIQGGINRTDKGNIPSLALFGLSTGKRVFLLPWLVLFLAVQIMLFIGFISSILHYPFIIAQLLILILLLLFFMAVWRQVQLQYFTMGLPGHQVRLGEACIGGIKKYTSSILHLALLNIHYA